jgi:cytochrome c553
MKRNKKFQLLALALSVSFILAISCEKNASDYNPPSDHTVSMSGYMHKSGYDQPLTNCIACHGVDLTGGTAGVSCYECHGKKW